MSCLFFVHLFPAKTPIHYYTTKKARCNNASLFSIFLERDLLTHHDLGDNIENLLVTAATTSGAMRDSLYVSESGKNAVEILMQIERVCDIRVAYLLTIADHIIFYHNNLHSAVPWTAV